MKINKSIIYKILITLGIVLAILVGGYFLVKSLGTLNFDREHIQSLVERSGAFGPIVFTVITILQVTLIPIPTTVTILAGNYVFGPWLSFLYSYVGLIIGSTVAFFLGRWLGKPYLYWLGGGKDKVDGWFKRLKGKEKVFLFFAFLFPFFPDDFLCSIAGALPISFFFFIVSQIITRVFAIAGNLIFLSGEVFAYEGFGLVIIITVIVVGLIALVLSFKYSEKLTSFFDKFVNKLASRRKSKVVDNEKISTEN